MRGTCSMFCQNCGNQISSNSSFCPYCGAIVSEMVQTIKSTDTVPLNPNSILKNGQYAIINQIGTGGEGTVYLALRNDSQTLYAIKEFSEDRALYAMQEFRILSCLCHPSIPSAYDSFYDTDCFYIVEEYISGQNLSQYVRTFGPFPEQSVYSIALRLCDVLGYINSKNIIHGDIKPSNIIMSDISEDIFLIDFGSASDVYSYYSDSLRDKTATITYASPEVLHSTGFTASSDIYSFGLTLLYLSTGKIDLHELTALTDPISDGLLDIIRKCTRVEPSARYQSFEQVKSAISELSRSSLLRSPNPFSDTQGSSPIVSKTSKSDSTASPCPNTGQFIDVDGRENFAKYQSLNMRRSDQVTSGPASDKSIRYASQPVNMSAPLKKQQPSVDIPEPTCADIEKSAGFKKRPWYLIIFAGLFLPAFLAWLFLEPLAYYPAHGHLGTMPTYDPLPALLIILAILAGILIFVLYKRQGKRGNDRVYTRNTDDRPVEKTVQTSDTDEPCIVFISYKQADNGMFTKDYYMAKDLYEKLAERKIKAFFSHESIQKRGDPSFESAIDEALGSCSVFVAVGSCKDFLNSRWVKYERETFHAMMMSGSKGNKSGMFSYVPPSFSHLDLPPMLASYGSYTDSDLLADAIVNLLSNAGAAPYPLSEKELRKQNAIRVDRELQPGHLIASRYLLLDIKKEGTYYKLFKAMDQQNRVKRLIKVINRYNIPENFHDSEAELLRTINYSGSPIIYDYQENDPDIIFCVMDYFTGINLGKLHKTVGKQDIKQLLQWFLNLCGILSYLHGFNGGYVHCNVKPSNIFIEENGELKLINFSSACRIASVSDIGRNARAVSPMYAAPEQLSPQGIIDVRTDIYAVGCTMLTLLTDVSRGFPKFFSPEAFGVSPVMSEIICKCMQPDPNNRYQTDKELIDDLKLALNDKYCCTYKTDHSIDLTSVRPYQPSQTDFERTVFIGSAFR